MTKNEDLGQVIQQLELALLDPSNRKSVDYLNKCISDDFVEFGPSGKIYNKQDVLEFVPLQGLRKFTVSDLVVKVLSQDVVLVTYKSVEGEVNLLRSSIWKRVGDEWVMVFHQSTRQT